MKERERILVGGLVTLMLILWLGFTVHRSPRFAGSLWGGVLGMIGAGFMFVPLAYVVVKRIKRLKKAVTKRVSMRTLLAWHIYAGVFGPILVLLHTGHKFESPLGIALTAMTLTVVISGYVGRYLVSQISKEIREKRVMLTQLNDTYQQTLHELQEHPEQRRWIRPFTGLFFRLAAYFFMTAEAVQGSVMPVSIRAIRLSGAIADLEYVIQTHETFKKAFAKWLKFHIVITIILYILLALHIWAAIYYGLRWFM